MRLIVTGGGTGGHLFPGIAVATGMQQRMPGSQVMFVGTCRQLDRDTLAGLPFAKESIHCMGLKGMGLWARLRSMLQLPGAVAQASGILKKFAPDLVFGVGGYVTGPVLLAAKMQKIPTCIHEQNSVPGLANRLAGKIADKVFISIPCEPSFSEKKTVQTGNPVRTDILKAAEARQQRQQGSKTILVLGGSQGAHRVNTLMLEAMEHVSVNLDRELQIIHQTGKIDLDMVRHGYNRLNIDAEVEAFFQDMARLYIQADLVVSRAGATTLAELSVMGLPALLIPFPYAADSHQETNALYYQHGGGALMFRESGLTGEALAGHIMTLLHKGKELHTMAANMKKMGKPEATGRIVDECLRLVTPLN